MAAKTLQFTKDGNKWVCETTVNNDYNLHIERVKAGGIWFFQRSTQEGQYVVCNGPGIPNPYTAGQVIDHAFGHGVYPATGMNIRIESETEVTGATLTEAE